MVYKSLLIGLWMMGFGVLSSCSSAEKTNSKMSNQEKGQEYLTMAMGAIKAKDFSKAFQDLQEAEALMGKNAQIYNIKAIAHTLSGQLPSAEIEVQKGLAIDPGHLPSRLTYGKILLDLKRYPEALQQFKAPAETAHFNDRHKALTAIGLTYFRMGKLANAQESFQTAILLGPNISCLAHYYSGHIAMRGDRLKEATEHYNKAAKGVCGGFTRAHYAKGMALLKDKKYDMARMKFLEIQKLFPESAEANKAIQRLKEIP